MQPFATWSLCVALGAAAAYLDIARLRRPLFGLLLLAGVAGGYTTTLVSPFDFSGAGWYMEGVLLTLLAALGLAGYVGAGALLLTALGVRRFVLGDAPLRD
jgi:hypothetical protein